MAEVFPDECDLKEDKVKIEWKDVASVNKTKVKVKSDKSTNVNLVNNNSDEYDQKLDATLKVHQTKLSLLGQQVQSAVTGGTLFGGVIGTEAAATGAISMWEFGAITVVGAVYGAVVGTGIFATDYVWTKVKNYKEQNQNNKVVAFNAKLDLYNEKKIKIENIFKHIRRLYDNLVKQEKKLNNYNFVFERYGIGNRKLITMIGPTGKGKSAVCNRLIGNKINIDDMEDDAEFKVGEFGQIDSETNTLNKITKQINIKRKHCKDTYELSVVDTPGAFDSEGNDKHFKNVMKHYFKACGGVNLFCVFFKFGDKLDENYKKLFVKYQTFWGEKMWKKCCIIITFCDKTTKKKVAKIDKILPEIKKALLKYLNGISNNMCGNIKFYEFGKNNFEKNTQDILISMINNNIKYKCDNILTPIDKIWKQIEKDTEEINKYRTEMKDIEKKLKILKQSIGNAKFDDSKNKLKKDN